MILDLLRVFCVFWHVFSVLGPGSLFCGFICFFVYFLLFVSGLIISTTCTNASNGLERLVSKMAASSGTKTLFC